HLARNVNDRVDVKCLAVRGNRDDEAPSLIAEKGMFAPLFCDLERVLLPSDMTWGSGDVWCDVDRRSLFAKPIRRFRSLREFAALRDKVFRSLARPLSKLLFEAAAETW